MMSTSADYVDVKVPLPVGLVEEAEASGLLTSAMVEAMLREELQSERIRRLFDAADRLAAIPGAPLSADEVENEIEIARVKRQKSGAGRP